MLPEYIRNEKVFVSLKREAGVEQFGFFVGRDCFPDQIELLVTFIKTEGHYPWDKRSNTAYKQSHLTMMFDYGIWCKEDDITRAT